ncbi:ribosomal protein S18-alanine N-acetyltransferase [Methanimicrococcus sp. OttesenSCG-928-J09]|nr:ribosomal protein S18-alanine N-acetyltransferase [Methanimicrococcus sp. OttesenSCG-928-J09]
MTVQLPPLSQQFFVRRYLPDDKYSILMLEAEAFNEHNPYEYINFYEVFRDGFFVCTLGSDVVGFIVGYALSESEGHIFSLAVSKYYRHQGIAERLIDHMCTYFLLKGLQKASLEVRVSNKPAINLYTKLGFTTAWVESQYYSDGEDGYVMMANLNSYFFRKEQLKVFGEAGKKEGKGVN